MNSTIFACMFFLFFAFSCAKHSEQNQTIDENVTKTKSSRSFEFDTVNFMTDGGVKLGRWVNFDSVSHNKISEGNYVDGKKDGIWMEYSDYGKLIRKVVYKKDIATDTIFNEVEN